MSKCPWMPIYWADYLGDTMHLTTAEHGAYLLLIGAYWLRGSALPDDDAYLARIARMDVRTWRKARTNVGRLFERVSNKDGAVLMHKRVEKELLKANARSTAASTAGQRSVNARSTKSQLLSEPDYKSPPESPPHEGGTNGHAKPKAERRKPAVPLPPEWQPDLDYARGLGMSANEINWQANSMIDRAKAKDERFVDWDARWRNWCRNYVNNRDERRAH